MSGDSVPTIEINVTQKGLIPELTISHLTKKVASSQGTVIINVSANVKWSVSDTCNWLDAVKTDATTITIDYTENEDVTERSAEITVTAPDFPGVVPQIINITQKGAKPSVLPDKTEVVITAEAGVITMPVTSNVNWAVSDTSSWLTVNKTDKGTITVTYDADTTVSDRSTEIIITAPGMEDQRIRIIQKGAVISAIPDIFEYHKVSIYPNPTKSMVYVSTADDMDTGFTISVFDIFGRVVHSRQHDHLHTKEPVIIDLSAYKNGLFLIKLNDSNSIKIEKVIKW